jgi:hypothetical protein
MSHVPPKAFPHLHSFHRPVLVVAMPPLLLLALVLYLLFFPLRHTYKGQGLCASLWLFIPCQDVPLDGRCGGRWGPSLALGLGLV